MSEHGYLPVHIVLQLDPPWTTDWMSQDARERLRQYGISPPQGHACHADMPAEVSCPRCGGTIPRCLANSVPRPAKRSIAATAAGNL